MTKLSELEVDTPLRVKPDYDRFTCLEHDTIYFVKKDEKEGFYIHCSQAKHFLDSQCYRNGDLIGLEKVDLNV